MLSMYNESSPQCHMRPQGYYQQAFRNNASTPCHGGFVHGNFPACNAYWPPCYPPQIPYHQCCVNHLGFYPAPCFVYQPWCGNEKDVDGVRRCGKCSPHLSYQNDGRGGDMIEEHEPEIQKGSRVCSTNEPNTTIWIPQEYESSSLGSVNHDKPCSEVKAPENTTVQKYFPNLWNGCFPFDEKTFKSLVQTQDRRNAENGKTVELPFDFSELKSLLRSQDVKGGEIQKTKEEPGHLLHSRDVKEEPGQLQYPFFWIPSHGKREVVGASESKESSSEGQKPQNVVIDIRGNKGNCERNVLSDVEKKISLRSIPVEKHQQAPRNIPVKLLENHLPKQTEATKAIVKKTEPVGNTKGEKHSSPAKAPRLPPVCLRVDPLPKKKNGGSKSLNSPRQEQPLKLEESKFISPLSSKKAETKTVPEVCSSKCEEANKEMKMFEEGVNAPVESNTKLQEGTNCEIAKPCETKKNEVKPAKNTFTEEQAAIVIQSVFRGYDVRRWEPIKKLKEIANVREQMEGITNRIKALEAPSDQQVVILGEMVMNLLLKLDSIQGLHPSIRDYRKSLARELSDIEDKLDSMKTSVVITEKETIEEQVEITSQTSDCPVNLEHIQLAEENKIVHETDREEPLETGVTEREVLKETMRLLEENQQFKEMMETLVKAGKEQLGVISKLTGRVKSLEKKLSHKKRRTRIGVRKPDRVKHATKPVSASLKDVV